MSSTSIKTIDSLKDYLYRAMQLEHATIPPYLTALYSIRPGSNPDAVHILRVVVVEEMLHLTLAANLMNSIGGQVNLTTPDFVPAYPAYLPDGEQDFQVPLERFSRSSVDTFLKIERPGKAPSESQRKLRRGRAAPLLAKAPENPEEGFYSIGEFYEEIRRGFVYLHEQHGSALFCGDPKRQVGPEYYYSGGGEVHVVTDLRSATAAIELISGQGEGLGGGIYDKEKELAHYYRFDQLVKGRYYQKRDEPHEPTGPRFEVDWDAVFPIKTNAKVSDYEGAPELKQAALDFNYQYARFLGLLTAAFDGQPQKLLEAVPEMFRLRDGMLQLMRNPLPGTDGTAAPTFEVASAGERRGT
jgi:hypothetical protein